MSEVAIVILNYNGKKFLQQFLPSVIRYSEGARIIVADNGSTDDSLTTLRNEFAGIEVIEIDKNLGFCGGYNFALGKVKAKYYVLLNSDVEVTPKWLHPLIHLLEGNTQIAAAQPKILSYHQKEKFEYAGAGGGFVDVFGFPFCRGRIFQSLEKDEGQFNDCIPVFWATGACLFIRSEAFHAMSGLDEDFFAHMEEIDLCWKLKRAGHQIYYCGESTVYHVGGGTLSASNPRKTFLNFRNGLILVIRHFTNSQLVWKLPVRLLFDWIAAFRFFLMGSWRDGAMVFKAHMEVLSGLGKEMTKRRKLRQLLKNDEVGQLFRRSIVVDFYLLGKRKFSEINNPKSFSGASGEI